MIFAYSYFIFCRTDMTSIWYNISAVGRSENSFLGLGGEDKQLAGISWKIEGCSISRSFPHDMINVVQSVGNDNGILGCCYLP